ncbi:MAG: GNAT family N-acetyltransferase [Leptospirales bacterium]|nr:GNAT family N-acetyltransferase [Leptospirales bacterium]
METTGLAHLLASVETAAFESPWSVYMIRGSLDQSARIGLLDVNGKLLPVRTLAEFGTLEAPERIGAYYLAKQNDDFTELLRIAVRPEFRRQGFAHRLMADLAGYGRILLEVSDKNQPALALYESAGYRTISRRKRYYGDGSDCIVMEKR